MDSVKTAEHYEAKFGLETFDLYRQAREYRIKIYQLIRSLPPHEKYCLATQMRRAAVSVSNNIAEGHGRWYYQENIHFCRIARGSVEEIIDDLHICADEQYGSKTEIEELIIGARMLIARINGYIVYLKKSKQGDE
jgi:four helix bundle protein